MTKDSLKPTREEVLAILAAASEQHPANLVGRDLSGLDLSGVDFKQANLTESRLLRTNFTRAKMFGVTLNKAIAREANFRGDAQCRSDPRRRPQQSDPP